MTNYLLSFDPTNPNLNQKQLALLIRVSREIESWHSPLPGTYMIKSNEKLETLQTSFLEFFGGIYFILSTVDPTRTGGFLPSTIWTWFSSGASDTWISLKQLVNLPPPPPTG